MELYRYDGVTSHDFHFNTDVAFRVYEYVKFKSS